MFNDYTLARFARETLAGRLAAAQTAQLQRLARAGAPKPVAAGRLRVRLGDALIAYGSRLKAGRQPQVAGCQTSAGG